MAQSLELPPPIALDNKDQAGQQTGSSQDVLKHNPPVLDKQKIATLKHYPGHEARRKDRPRETLTAPHGEEKTLAPETGMRKEVVERFTESMSRDMDRLIKVRQDFSSDQDFKKFLTESGHSYYVELFDKFVQEKPNTNGRVREINQSAIDEFMSVDKGLSIAYRIKQKQMQEQALAAAMVFSMNKNEAENVLPGPGSVEITKGGVLRGHARSIRHWWTSKTGSSGRQSEQTPVVKLLADTKGRLTLTMVGANATSALVGGIALGPPGALLGPAAVNGAAGLIHASRSGEYLQREISADALQTFLGDPNSPTPEKQIPDASKIKWMKTFHNMDPEDFSINARGEIVRKNRISETGVTLAKKLVDDLNGSAKDIMAFQKEDGIPAELRRPMNIDWILEGTRSRPTQGTDAEQAVMEKFNPNREGLRDRNNNTVEVQAIQGIQVPELIPVFVPILDASGTAQVDQRTRETLLEQVFVPRMQQAVDAAGAPMFDSSGNPIMLPVMRTVSARDGIGQQIPEMVTTTDSAGNFVSVPDMIRLQDVHGHGVFDTHGVPVMIPRSRTATHADISLRPILDAQGNQTWGENPEFDWNNLDIAGNAERMLKAEEEVIKKDVKEIFQSIVDGKTDHLILFKDRLKAAKEGHRSGKMVDAEQKRLTKEKAALTTDTATLTSENEALTSFQKSVAEQRKEIQRIAREQEKSLRSISIDGKPTATPAEKQAALQKALAEGGTEITIKGTSINSIANEQKTLEEDIRDRAKDFETTYVQPLREAVGRAEGSLATPTTDRQELAVRQRALDTANARLSSMIEQARQNEQTIRESAEFKNRAEAIERRRAVIEQTLDALSGGTDNLTNARESLLSSDTVGRQNTDLAIMAMRYSFDNVLAWSIPGVTSGTLVTSSYSDLEKAMNDANTADRTKGWPKDANTLADNRIMLIHAMAEARAQNAEAEVRTPNADLTSLTDVMTYGFSELDLYSLSAEEIGAAITEKRGLNPSLGAVDITTLRTVKDAVAKRLGARQRGINQLLINLDKRETETTEKLTKLVEKGISTPEIEAIDRAYGRFGKIVEKFMEQMPEQADRNTFFEYTPPTSGTASGTIDEDKAYRNIMDLIFNHKQDYDVNYNGETGPEAAFARNKKVLDKKSLADLIITHFKITVPGSSLKGALEKIREVDQKHLANFFSSVVLFEHLEKKIP